MCVLLETGAVRCWGQGEYGVMGTGETDDKGNDPDELPTADIPLDGPVKALAAGMRHVCALLTTGQVQCWGLDQQGQAGKQQIGLSVGDQPDEMPPPTIALPLKTTAIGAGLDHTCAILETGAVRCWGNALYGATGLSTLTKDVKGITDAAQIALCELLPPPPALVDGVQAITAGNAHTCALLTSDMVHCWGQGTWYGCLGDMDSKQTIAPPETAVDLGAGATLLSSSSGYLMDATLGTTTCALLTDDSLHCWGNNSYGQLGLGDVEPIGDNETPRDFRVPY